MGQELRAREPVFREALEACAKAMGPYLDGSLLEELGAPEEKYHLTRIDRVQPMLFAMQVSLTALWRAWGVEPDAVMGHSMGEVAAAHVAGALSLEDAARVICERSKLVTRAAGRGGMALTELSLSEAKAAIGKYGERVSIAASNSPRSTVLSGEKEALEEILRELGERGVFARWVRVDFASHSAQMDPLRGELLERLRGIRPKAGTVAIHSTLLGRVIDGSEMDAKYWGDNLREPVLLARMVGRQLEEEEGTVFVEVSAHPILTTDVEACGAKAVQPTLRRHTPERASMLGTLGALWSAGSAIDWSRQHPKAGQVVDLPTYPWQRQRHWIEPRSRTGTRRIRQGAHPFIGDPVELAGEARTTLFEGRIDAAHTPYLEDHRVEGLVVLPGTAYLEMALAAAEHLFESHNETNILENAPQRGETPVLENVTFEGLMALPTAPAGASAARDVQLRATSDGSPRHAFHIHSRGDGADGTWTAHASGTLGRAPAREHPTIPLEEVRARLGTHVPGHAHYEALAARGLEYGARFRGVEELWRRDGEALGRIELPDALRAESSAYRIHPALLDAAFQVLAGALPLDATGTNDAYLPVGVARLTLRDRPAAKGFSHAVLRTTESGDFQGDITLTDENGRPVIAVEGLRLQRFSAGARTARADILDDWFYERVFREQPRLEPRAAESAAKAPARDWLIFADRTIAPQLAAHGLTGVHVPREGLDIDRPEAFAALLAEHFSGRAPAGILYLWPLDAPRPDASGGLTALHAAEKLGPIGVLHLVQALVQAGFRDPPRLWIVTRGAQTLDPGHRDASHAAAIETATLWGLAPTVAHEHPELRTSLIDLSPASHDINELVSELLANGSEDQIAHRASGRYVARIVRRSSKESTSTPATSNEATSNEATSNEATNTPATSNEATSKESTNTPPTSNEATSTQATSKESTSTPATSESTSNEATSTPATGSASLERAGERPYRLVIDSPGALDSLVLRQAKRRAPGPGEIEVAVEAAGLNFLDVLSALGLRPDPEPGAREGKANGEVRLGGECSGKVSAVGEGVSLAVGDEVVGIAPFAFASHATTVERFVVKKPERLDFAQAATIPIAFMTAQHALVHLARIERGERVLVHAASGGTGLAAVQIARRAGAEIFATAGSEAKRDYLRSIGITHVFDSRSTAFADAIMTATGGAGVDVVLNSLSGDMIPKSLDVLAPYGRFLEIGKRDIYEDRTIGLAPFRKNIAYHGIDLSRMAVDRPQRFAALLEEVMSLVARGELDPLPLRSYPLSDAVTAFHEMARARHIGKLVLHGSGPDAPIAPPAEAATIRDDVTYLITGGLGGVGTVLARGLVERGARFIALLGRSTTPSGAAAAALDSMRASGARVLVLSADVAEEAQLGAALATLDASMPPLGGVIHGAVVLDDGILLQQRAARFRTVMAPKVDGAWNLHVATRGLPLDFFVMLSSTASILGSAGQSNYAAASAFLDALALHRRALGLPGQSINWGPWAEVGLAAAHTNRGERGAAAGMASIAPALGIEAFVRLLGEGTPRAAVMPFRFRRWAQSYPRAAAAPIFTELQREAGAVGDQRGAGTLRASLLTADPSQRRARIEAHLREQIAKVLRLDPARIGPATELKGLGLDSLMALSLRNRLEESFGVQLSATLVWGYPTVAALAPYLAEKMKLELSGAAEGANDEGVETGAARDEAVEDDKERKRLADAMQAVTALSEDEALAALLEG
ncbi:SDR family NAD(P)-dependent oxidoreductase [Pendulispora albinea]|uniref:SDR family NAD(P)-dependent oxidoreductase n=2 Tax=Pendulispora albinea TaxID=2741071 RepID=A0ABZ2MCQ7_9BACT